MRQMQVASTLIVAALALVSSGGAASVGRQRRVQTTATSTGPAQAAVFGLPLWHTTFNSNDEYIETPVGKPQLQRAAAILQLQQQPAAPEEGRHAAELGFAPEMMMIDALSYLQEGASKDEGRHLFHHFRDNKENKSTIWDDKTKNITTVNINNNNVTVLAPEAAATGTRFVSPALMRNPQLLQYFETRQGQQAGQSAGLSLPYQLIDLNSLSLASALAQANAVNGVGSLNGISGISGVNAINGISSLSGLSAMGGGVPLVPVTLGNNAVGYVPLNLRMFRQLPAAGAPLLIRENEEEIVADSEPEPEQEQERHDTGGAVEEAAPAQKVTVARFPLLAQRLRRPAAAATISSDGYAIRNPLLSFRGNMRRVQYL